MTRYSEQELNDLHARYSKVATNGLIPRLDLPTYDEGQKAVMARILDSRARLPEDRRHYLDFFNEEHSDAPQAEPDTVMEVDNEPIQPAEVEEAEVEEAEVEEAEVEEDSQEAPKKPRKPRSKKPVEQNPNHVKVGDIVTFVHNRGDLKGQVSQPMQVKSMHNASDNGNLFCTLTWVEDGATRQRFKRANACTVVDSEAAAEALSTQFESLNK